MVLNIAIYSRTEVKMLVVEALHVKPNFILNDSVTNDVSI